LFNKALGTAASNQASGAVRVLLENRHDIDIDCVLWQYWNEDILLLLLSAVPENTPNYHLGQALMAASIRGHLTIVQLLLRRQVGPDMCSERDGYYSPLKAASYYGHLEIVQFLLLAGAIVDLPGGEFGTPLQNASARGHVEVVRCLLKNGANPNGCGGTHGDSFQIASERGYFDVLELLLSAARARATAAII
jgi:ankyrin repeat protein